MYGNEDMLILVLPLVMSKNTCDKYHCHVIRMVDRPILAAYTGLRVSDRPALEPTIMQDERRLRHMHGTSEIKHDFSA